MMGWGCGADTGRRLTLWLLGGLVVAAFALLWGGCESAEARARTQGTWCERTGRTYNVNGDVVKSGRWSEDGMRTWREP